MGDFFFCILSMTRQLLLTSGRKDFNLIIRQTQLCVACSCCCRALCARYYLILYLRSMGRKKNKVSNAKNVKYINKSIFFLKTLTFKLQYFWMQYYLMIFPTHYLLNWISHKYVHSHRHKSCC